MEKTDEETPKFWVCEDSSWNKGGGGEGAVQTKQVLLTE